MFPPILSSSVSARMCLAAWFTGTVRGGVELGCPHHYIIMLLQSHTCTSVFLLAFCRLGIFVTDIYTVGCLSFVCWCCRSGEKGGCCPTTPPEELHPRKCTQPYTWATRRSHRFVTPIYKEDMRRTSKNTHFYLTIIY